MVSRNNDIKISRNETFDIDKIIKYQDGSPYIVSNKLNNPYILVSVASTIYAQKDRKVYNKWLSLKDTPMFTNTTPINLKSLMTEANGNISRYNSFNDITMLQTIDGLPDILAYGYVGNYIFYYTPRDAVFYIEDEEGIRTYKYWDNGWKDYEFRIVTSFGIDMTSEWTGQNYVYSIDLVSGISTREYLVSLAENNNIYVDITTTNEELYNQLINEGVNFIETFNLEREIVVFDICKPILKPKKLTVSSTILGGL